MAGKKYSTERVYDGYMRVNSCGRQWLNDRDYTTLRRDGRVDYSIFYLAHGRGSYLHEGKEESFSEGSLVLYFPRVPHHYKFHQEDESRMFWSHFSGTCCERLSALASSSPVVIPVRDRKQFEYLFEQMIDAHYDRSAGDFLCDSYMLLLLALILQDSPVSAPAAHVAGDEPLAQVISQMHLHFNQPISIPRYAALCHLSEDRFIRVFKASTGLPPYRYQLRIRIRRAVEMLENTTATVGEIAEAVGFSDTAYFSRIFKKFTGHPPSYYKS